METAFSILLGLAQFALIVLVAIAVGRGSIRGVLRERVRSSCFSFRSNHLFLKLQLIQNGFPFFDLRFRHLQDFGNRNGNTNPEGRRRNLYGFVSVSVFPNFCKKSTCSFRIRVFA